MFGSTRSPKPRRCVETSGSRWCSRSPSRLISFVRGGFCGPSLARFACLGNKKAEQATLCMARSSYVILLKKTYGYEGRVAAKPLTENTLSSGHKLASLREHVDMEIA